MILDGEPQALAGAMTEEDTPGVITHLQRVSERKCISLARSLHDDLGGHLVSAVMDVGWMEHHVNLPVELQQRMSRVRHALGAAIDLKRNLIEELRPSLLDNFGLFAAYRWHVKHACKRAAVTCTEEYPETEPNFTAEASTGLFRIVQEMVELIISEDDVMALTLRVALDEQSLELWVRHEHREVECVDMIQTFPQAMRAMQNRIGVLKGRMTVDRQSKGTALRVQFPLEMLATN